ncbi:MAG: hypothetical protein O2840_00965 [bacterium]|nr:hypothetical protein [bacterium]
MRLYKLGEAPPGLYWDETAILIDMQTVVESGKDMHGNSFLQPIYPSYGDFKAPGLPILASFSGLLFGVSGWSLRFVSVFAWAISTISGLGILWLLAKHLSRTQRQILSLAFLVVTSFAPWSFFFSRIAFESMLSQAWILVSVLFLLLSMRPSSKKVLGVVFLFLSVLFGASAGYTYFAARYIWPGILVVFFLFTFVAKKNRSLFSLLKQSTIGMSMLGVYALLLLPLTHSEWYQASQNLRLSAKSVLSFEAKMTQASLSNHYKELADNSILSWLVFHREVFLLQAFAKNMADHVHPTYLFLTGDSNLRHGTGKHGLMLLSFLPFFIMGSYSLWKKDKALLLALSTWYLVAVVPASIAEETPHAMRTLAGMFPILSLVSFGVLAFVQIFNNHKQTWQRAVLLGWVLVVCFDIFSYFYYYFGSYQLASRKAWQAGFDQVVTLVETTRQPEEKVLIDFYDDRLFLWFLASGKYSPAELQALLANDHQVKTFDNLTFGDSTTLSVNELMEYEFIAKTSSDESQLITIERRLK